MLSWNAAFGAVTVPVLIQSVILGVCAFYLVEWVRTLPKIEVWVAESKKPWACHVCMSGWMSIALHLALIFGAGLTPVWGLTGPGAAAVCLALLYWTDSLVKIPDNPFD